MASKSIVLSWQAITFIILAIVFGVVLHWLVPCRPLYWVTIYITSVTLLISYVQGKYREPISSSAVPKHSIVSAEDLKPKSTEFKLSEILLSEFVYAKETAAQAMNDRLTMLNYFLLSAGVVVAGIGVMVSKEGGYEFPYRDESVIALSLIFNMVGWVYFLNQVRLRQAWCESARAMNHIKQVFVEYCGYPQEKAKAFFRWNIETIPRASKKMTVFYFSALLISILNASAIVLATTIVLGIDHVSEYWVVPIILGFHHLFFQMSMYTALLEEPAPSPNAALTRSDAPLSAPSPEQH
jgi:hypothetical protein